MDEFFNALVRSEGILGTLASTALGFASGFASAWIEQARRRRNNRRDALLQVEHEGRVLWDQLGFSIGPAAHQPARVSSSGLSRLRARLSDLPPEVIEPLMLAVAAAEILERRPVDDPEYRSTAHELVNRLQSLRDAVRRSR